MNIGVEQAHFGAANKRNKYSWECGGSENDSKRGVRTRWQKLGMWFNSDNARKTLQNDIDLTGLCESLSLRGQRNGSEVRMVASSARVVRYSVKSHNKRNTYPRVAE